MEEAEATGWPEAGTQAAEREQKGQEPMKEAWGAKVAAQHTHEHLSA